MGADDTNGERAEAIGLLQRALALIDARGFGTLAAPHVDLALHLLVAEQAEDQAIDAR